MEVSGQLYVLSAVSLGRQHCVPNAYEGWVDPIGELDFMEKRKVLNPDSWTIQLVA
jgi:hypothetical protein